MRCGGMGTLRDWMRRVVGEVVLAFSGAKRALSSISVVDIAAWSVCAVGNDSIVGAAVIVVSSRSSSNISGSGTVSARSCARASGCRINAVGAGILW